MATTSMGEFIAERRKALKLTQIELAQKLGVKENDVIRWEEKNVYPKNELVLPLCEVLDISSNELLSGRKLQDDETKTAGEDCALRYVKSQNDLKVRKIIELVLIAVNLLSCVVCLFIAFSEDTSTAFMVVLIIMAVICLATAITATCLLFKDESEYECPNCKTRFKPEIRDFMQSKKEGSTRKLHCPNCEKETDCKCKSNIIRFVKK